MLIYQVKLRFGAMEVAYFNKLPRHTHFIFVKYPTNILSFWHWAHFSVKQATAMLFVEVFLCV